MTVKTMLAKRSNMPVLRRRAKTMMRKKFKKTIKLSDVDKIWMDYVEHGIIRRLLIFGKVQIDSKFSLEIVGKKIINDPKMFSLLINGLNLTSKGELKKGVVFDKRRPDIRYKIVLTDKNYKNGNLIFQADRKLSNRVHQQLINTNTAYRIENVSK